jgi:hypothetical protein
LLEHRGLGLVNSKHYPFFGEQLPNKEREGRENRRAKTISTNDALHHRTLTEFQAFSRLHEKIVASILSELPLPWHPVRYPAVPFHAFPNAHNSNFSWLVLRHRSKISEAPWPNDHNCLGFPPRSVMPDRGKFRVLQAPELCHELSYQSCGACAAVLWAAVPFPSPSSFSSAAQPLISKLTTTEQRPPGPP